ncbi:MAG TPA: hypothetical protein VGM30_11085 [Puia sp.]|jgi:hypothetical protein
MEPTELIQDLNRVYALELTDHLTLDQLETLLAEKIDLMIRKDFSALVQLLYRIDVNETKLRHLLADADPATGTAADAGRIIARSILERQWQKIETRRQYSTRKGDNETNEERW